MIAGLPYDAEVEYLESTGTQYVDTGVTMTSSLFENSETTIKFQPTVVDGATRNFFGDGTSWDKGYTFGFIVNGNIQACNGYRRIQNGLSSSLSTPNTLVVTKRGFNLNGTFSLGSGVTDAATTSGSLLLFGARRNGVFFTATPFAGRIFSAKMVASGKTVFDYIPVRKGAVGYMYDRVTRKLFGNAGTGSFVLGPDVATPVMGLRKYPQIGGAA